MGLRAAMVVHPASGLGRAGRIAGAVADRLRGAVDDLVTVRVDSVEESRRLMGDAHAAGLDLLVVVGGDGSVHQGVQFCADRGVALAVIPAGTGNDLARTLGAPTDPLAAADALVADIRADRRTRIDLGKVEGGPWFAGVLCAGFDSAVNERANRMRWPRGPRRYDLAIVAELARLRAARLSVVEDGTRADHSAATQIAIGNVPHYGGGIPICPAADPTDGLFDITLVGRATRLDLVRMLPGLRTGRHVEHRLVTATRAREVSLGEDNGWVAYADGERIGPLPVRVTCVPNALEVFGRVVSG
ncbi:diacylglycerol/lipid kinase family protein [Actinophytocola gossypii]|uniref:Sphingosine kinase n=1 Tax=Actinophytocola gossypii TaxID=2812003 RepID=A0ABT2J6Y4_9PSEU|nr:diacylglycerol kinase family protein [Actinophytocola gossypii]MCT2583622.1 sphingosine kinase [Actinophytocola gossypii]